MDQFNWLFSQEKWKYMLTKRYVQKEIVAYLHKETLSINKK